MDYNLQLATAETAVRDAYTKQQRTIVRSQRSPAISLNDAIESACLAVP